MVLKDERLKKLMARRPPWMRRHFSEKEQIDKIREVLNVLERVGKKGTGLSKLMEEVDGQYIPGLFVLALGELEKKGYVFFVESQEDEYGRAYYLTKKYYEANSNSRRN
ncbi:hypothetical protein HYT25_03795 [Candidatus Pacearchaeota archaeon]|nr:hypothetical protein [Candidatus Pacearchaeota archaeon]